MRKLWIVKWEAASLMKTRKRLIHVLLNLILVWIFAIKDLLSELCKFVEML